MVMYATSLMDSRSGRWAGGQAAVRSGEPVSQDVRVARVPAPRKPADDVTEVLEHRPEAAGAARCAARAALERWRVAEDTAETVVLVVSELVTNAVEHAQPPLALHLHRERGGNGLWVGVSDGGPAPRHGQWASSCAEDEHGRGLSIVDTLSNSHGSRRFGGRTTHWARLAAL
ncbi:ATP-binding protein [Streptomyces chartreusis]|uniref:ATP-binding protein n=1 Tax=Streptomyces chartreusis TaxID=1969 RepID=UPI0036959B67